MAVTENVRYVAALARAVDLLRRSPEPGAQQKAALRALVAQAATRSATFRFYEGVLTLDAEEVLTTDPRLAAFGERLIAHDIAEIVIAQGAGPDELLALAFGLASEPGQGRIKERLRDAGSGRVMVVLHQYRSREARSVSAAFEKLKTDQAVMSEWNAFLERGARSEADRLAGTEPGPESAATVPPARGRRSTMATIRPNEVSPDAPAAAPRRMPRPSTTIDVGTTPESWFAAFERDLKKRFADHFGDVDWGFRVDRAGGSVTVGDPHTGATFVVQVPPDYLERSSWLVAGDLLTRLRGMAEKSRSLKKKR